MKNRWLRSTCIGCIVYILCASAVYGAEGEEKMDETDGTEQEAVYNWILNTGELFYLPVEGEVLEYTEELLQLQDDGSYLAAASGEGEIIVRYRIQMVEAPERDEETDQEDSDELIETEELLPDLPNETEEEMIETGEALPPAKVDIEEEEITLEYDKRYEKESVTGDFEAVILLPKDKKIQIISCSVNGREEEYTITDNRLVIDKEELQEGKNRVLVTVKDEEGNMTVMEPWEFTVEKEDKTPKEKKVKEDYKKTDEKREQTISFGMCLLLIGGTLVYYEKKRYREKKHLA